MVEDKLNVLQNQLIKILKLVICLPQCRAVSKLVPEKLEKIPLGT